jgi:hypothetical protein
MAKEQSIKGEKGFQSLPKQLIKSKRVVMRLTQKEKEALERYTKEHKTTVSELLRHRIKDIITPKPKK